MAGAVKTGQEQGVGSEESGGGGWGQETKQGKNL